MKPIVIGSGIGGLLVSDRLSEGNHPHILIAGPPVDPDTPRLGESMSLHGTFGLRETYPEARHLFTPKRSLSIALKGQDLSFDFDFSRSFLRRMGFHLAATEPPRDLIHVDRGPFDHYLYQRVVQKPAVEVLQSRVASIETDRGSVRSATLEDGTCLETEYVFDATNAGRVLAGPLGVRRRDLSERHRVVFTHFCRKPNRKPPLAGEWLSRTNIIRLYRDIDGLEAVAWCIPLPDKVSVGASLIRDADVADEELVSLAVSRFEAQGLPIRAEFPDQHPIQRVENQYYTHDRAYGDNWMLVGPAFANVWWPSSTGVGAALAAAENASLALSEPLTAGRRYQRYMDTLLTIHRSLDGLLLPDSDRLDDRVIHNESVRRNMSEAERWLMSPRLRRNPLIRFSGPLQNIFLKVLLQRIRLCQVSDRNTGSTPISEHT